MIFAVYAHCSRETLSGMGRGKWRRVGCGTFKLAAS